MLRALLPTAGQRRNRGPDDSNPNLEWFRLPDLEEVRQKPGPDLPPATARITAAIRTKGAPRNATYTTTDA